VSPVAQDIDIRPVRPSEYAIAGAVTAGAYREFARAGSPGWIAYQARIADVAGRAPRTTVLVASIDATIVGSATLELDARMDPASTQPLAPDEAHLRMLGVDPRSRGRGVARQLVEACIALARERGKRRLTLETGRVMVAAQELYRSMGFTLVRERDTPDGVHLLEYSLDIDAAPEVTR
jgi:ribosomal protein S18 acetylase RimI-like enzyme